jgi:hypothetical protein
MRRPSSRTPTSTGGPRRPARIDQPDWYEMQEPEIHCRCPRLPAQTWAAAALERKSGPLNRQWL